MKKWVKKIYVVTFLLSFNSKLSHFDKNLNLDLTLNKMAFNNLEKTDMVLIYSEVLGYLELTANLG
jgi:hypothetical protein